MENGSSGGAGVNAESPHYPELMPTRRDFVKTLGASALALRALGGTVYAQREMPPFPQMKDCLLYTSPSPRDS